MDGYTEKQRQLQDVCDDDEAQDCQKDKHLTFTVGGEDYGIDIYHVTEIIGIQKITDVPDMPACIKGVINLRGRMVPVMDVRLRFGMPARQYDERTCIVVVTVHGASVGLVVDTVKEVADIPESQIEMPPDMARAGSQRYVKGLGKLGSDVKILLDVQRLLLRDGLADHPFSAHAGPDAVQAAGS